MENKMYARQAFKCSVCGQEYDNAMNRAHCELNCIRKQEEEAKKAAYLKKKEEQDARHKEVVEAYDRFHELLEKYTADYGTFVLNSNVDVPTFSKLIDHFWF
ncbi:MAG: hypothetical protein IJ444_02150 [Kiritimatiellae bacterium]|nr:hypothetical protein [Kiritimatiellia bacterium]